MKRKSFVAISLLLMAVGISFFAYSRHHAAESRNPLAMANVEALTEEEMPHVKDCVYDPCVDCGALHPTDPNKDEYRKNARWPSK